jgi:anaerobic selenocysteine-containing dehydrogenase
MTDEGPTLWISSADAATYGIADKGRTTVSGPGGDIEVTAEITDRVPPGTVCYPHGWGHKGGSWKIANALGGANVNELATSSLAEKDQLSGASHLDGIPVAVRSAEPVASGNRA